MDIGGTNIRVGLVDRALHVDGFLHTSSDGIQGDDAPERLAFFIDAYIQEHCAGLKPIAISIGFPSTLDKERRKLFSTPNLIGFDNVDIVDRLENALGIPVLVDRDVNLLFRYDCHVNNLPMQGFVVGCYIGTGIGNVIAYNGEILTGKNGVAAEMGHIPMHNVAGVCGCGNVGCTEMLASGKRLAELQAELFPDTDMSELFTRHGREPILQKFVDDLTLPVATEINLLDPEYLILGGGVLQMKDFPLEMFEDCLLNHVRKPYPAENLQIRYARSTPENGVVGAAIYAYSKENAYDCARQ